MSVLFSTTFHYVGVLIDRFILQYKTINTACLGYELQYDKFDKYIKILQGWSQGVCLVPATISNTSIAARYTCCV